MKSDILFYLRSVIGIAYLKNYAEQVKLPVRTKPRLANRLSSFHYDKQVARA